ncbi:MAG: twin-arginine translocation signal domain-containing protein [Planctomycetia bacterium]|nr:twin-arginine translocation signal domain-containing protein [Planctomycetia bacterium]
MKKDELPRRDVLKATAAAGVAATLGGAIALPGTLGANFVGPQRQSDAIRKENEKRGATDWQLTYARVDPATKYRSPWIEGFVSDASLRAGETLELFVSTRPAAPFRVDFYRLGHYGGAGGRLMLSQGPFQGKPQPDPPVGEERLRECRWEATTSLKIPADWLSGVYLGKLSLLNGRYQSYVVFIVRDDRPADLLFQCSDNTWQAYNRWPDNFSLYDNGQTPWNLIPGVKVGFDRPYGKYCQIFDNPLSQGSGEFLLWEFPLAFWLEEHGYDVTYCSNTDVHADAACLTRCKTFLSVGHDEYWSLTQFRHVKEAVEAGVSACFFSGNTCCFVAPYSASSDGRPNRVITRAGRYGGLSEEEKAYMGPFPTEGPNEASLIGARTVSPFNGSGDWIVADPSSWIFEGTGMKKGDAIPGLVGWEFHGDPAKIAGLDVVAEGETINGGGKKAHWTATLYPGPKNNWVFNASTIYWAQGLSSPPGHMLPIAHYGRPHGPDARVKRITKNLLARMTASP